MNGAWRGTRLAVRQNRGEQRRDDFTEASETGGERVVRTEPVEEALIGTHHVAAPQNPDQHENRTDDQAERNHLKNPGVARYAQCFASRQG